MKSTIDFLRKTWGDRFDAGVGRTIDAPGATTPAKRGSVASAGYRSRGSVAVGSAAFLPAPVRSYLRASIDILCPESFALPRVLGRALAPAAIPSMEQTWLITHPESDPQSFRAVRY
jgi:hypothetical protein